MPFCQYRESYTLYMVRLSRATFILLYILAAGHVKRLTVPAVIVSRQKVLEDRSKQ